MNKLLVKYSIEFVVVVLGIGLSFQVDDLRQHEYDVELKNRSLLRIRANIHSDIQDAEQNIYLSLPFELPGHARTDFFRNGCLGDWVRGVAVRVHWHRHHLTAGLLGPRTGHFSNSFYSNVDELLALRDSLEEEGLIAKLVALPGIAEKAPNAAIPYRP